jgi:hypothetical protein
MGVIVGEAVVRSQRVKRGPVGSVLLSALPSLSDTYSRGPLQQVNALPHSVAVLSS